MGRAVGARDGRAGTRDEGGKKSRTRGREGWQEPEGDGGTNERD